MADHPIQGLMITAMENLKEMVDVNKVVGDAVETPDGHIIIPVSRVTFGFVAGGSEFDFSEDKEKTSSGHQNNLPFGGGSGGGVSIQPMAFLVVGPGEVRLLPVDRNAVLDRLVDLAPQVIQQIQNIIKPEQNAGMNVKL
ncbi:MAG: GerW family sporulation protein [Bacillota bacterium]|nr:GerW family sporulation protein [Bacillota bacterium]